MCRPPTPCAEVVDWRAYAATRGLTDKQQKLADKIRKREARVQNLQVWVGGWVECVCLFGGGGGGGRPPRHLQVGCSNKAAGARGRHRGQGCRHGWRPPAHPCPANQPHLPVPCPPQRECDKIRGKEQKMEELSAGQATTLVR